MISFIILQPKSFLSNQLFLYQSNITQSKCPIQSLIILFIDITSLAICRYLKKQFLLILGNNNIEYHLSLVHQLIMKQSYIHNGIIQLILQDKLKILILLIFDYLLVLIQLLISILCRSQIFCMQLNCNDMVVNLFQKLVFNKYLNTYQFNPEQQTRASMNFISTNHPKQLGSCSIPLLLRNFISFQIKLTTPSSFTLKEVKIALIPFELIRIKDFSCKVYTKK
ncbi:unnamed protein product (macronuclear) [Paramecium tetraurelia]|uniref:Transmembrane protein n=1 Tax=Paramecium tetraurelia TaxID=5888 RepID=A0DK33_PARTE|nr:uncharacterized protein GSPATT00039551001 [Paramecium tetraurelia]CAK83400.1 unnamed protein product [Paramecium tetraurelia]|eukprot:XP_001450797.1 hypothetical protein (macronuclear) [Paramecium tetraurelia strain d4-2]